MAQVKMTLGNLRRDKNELKREKVIMTTLFKNVTGFAWVRLTNEQAPYFAIGVRGN